ncbi:hypothetical protein [Paraglaciecola psychrophila]|jgi:hypothetical protein|uniref:HEPN AbiU2-like domain-containing protein n=1 Tax=Paraglaciecola psychrophila 170 TaxID=1129794 RepID=K7ANE0_9ALTE|nr:hypothetical protein [Paraglaciecola psychrophila]AGH44483.1 hypothetical protein C427_2374 [Paraglaciecola psychrophila 170]GAC36840.1 hypothetical protein GPSY_1203 [Paraglaciecola psychrophila 170]
MEEIKDPELKNTFQYYYRVLLSYSDFKHAERCAKRLVEFGDTYIPENETLEAALYSSMLVSYSRPFNSGGNSQVGNIPRLTKNIIKSLTRKEQKLHNYILLLRNKLIAHSDAEFINLDPVVAIDISKDFIVPIKNDPLAPFNESYNRECLSLCEKLIVWALEERAAIEPRVIPHLKKVNFAQIYE